MDCAVLPAPRSGRKDIHERQEFPFKDAWPQDFSLLSQHSTRVRSVRVGTTSILAKWLRRRRERGTTVTRSIGPQKRRMRQSLGHDCRMIDGAEFPSPIGLGHGPTPSARGGDAMWAPRWVHNYPPRHQSFGSRPLEYRDPALPVHQQRWSGA